MQWLEHNWLSLVAVAFLIGAPFSIDLAVYYQFMNWVVLGAALMVAYRAKKADMKVLMWLFALVAVVFNPFAPLYLKPVVWKVVDIIVAVMFVSTFFFLKTREGK